MIDTYQLFPANIFKYQINPSSYDKQDLIDTCLRNYAKDPNRNVWDGVSKLHHTHRDTNNPKFEKINEESLLKTYIDICLKIIPYLNLKINILNIEVKIENFSVNAVYMEQHNHCVADVRGSSVMCVLTGVHYISLGQEHTPTTFINPSMGFYLNEQKIKTTVIDEYFNFSKEIFKTEDIKNSFYAKEFIVPTKEDDVILFPAHLNHFVNNDPNSFFNKPRIVSAFNVLIIV